MTFVKRTQCPGARRRAGTAHHPIARLALLGCTLCWLAAPPLAAADDPVLAQLPDTASAPPDNAPTPAKIELGRQLFFDARLSGDNMMSCATCHQPDKAFADGLAQAVGRAGKRLPRNTPSLLNVGFHRQLFWDGRATTLEQQTLVPIQSPDEMHQELDRLERELNQVGTYVEQFQKVFGSSVTRDGVAKALAAFQRSLVTKPAPLDRYLAGDKSALSAEAKRGMDLFVGDAGCIRCHHGPLLSDGKFYRIGIASGDEGVAALTGMNEDKGKFRTPSLRNVAMTAPYMHDGSKQTLYDVVEFYLREVPAQSSDGLPLDVEPLAGQSFSDIPAIVAFLESLTGKVHESIRPELP